jgi:hypothetical protein
VCSGCSTFRRRKNAAKYCRTFWCDAINHFKSHKFINWYLETGINKRRTGQGRKRITTANQDRFLRLQTLRQRFVTSTSLQEAENVCLQFIDEERKMDFVAAVSTFLQLSNNPSPGGAAIREDRHYPNEWSSTSRSTDMFLL